MSGRDPYALFHDELSGEDWWPIAVVDLAEQAARHGLGYVGELRGGDRWRTWASPEDAERIAADTGPSAAAQQQYIDDVTGAAFHDSLFVKGGSPERPPAGAVPERLARGAADWILRWNGAPSPAESTPADHAAMTQVRQAGAAGVVAGELARELEVELSVALAVAARLDAFGVVTLAASEPPVAAAPTERPTTSGLVRAQARAGHSRLASLRHRSVVADDPGLRLVLALADGTRDRAALEGEFVDAGIASDRAEAVGLVDAALEAVARSGFLWDPAHTPAGAVRED